MNIRVENLSFKYDKGNGKNILKNIDLSIKNETINTLLGLNGSGKTTFLKLLVGLEKAGSGHIFYDEKEISKISIRERSKIFSYVPQYSNITADVTVFDYLSFGTANMLKFYQSPRKGQLELVDKISEKLKIDHLLNKNMSQLSGGEKQIVLIASSLIQSTPVMVLDEPTSALDIKNQYLVLSILKEVSMAGKTVVLSSHNPNHSLFLNSNVILIDNGVIREEGAANKLITVDKLKHIYGLNICLSKEQKYDEISFRSI